MSKNKKNKSSNSKEEQNFYEKMKTDKRYNAKVQFIAYGAFILLLIIFLNINNNTTSNNTITPELDNDNKEVVEEVSLLELINNNYEYDVNVLVNKNKTETINHRYYGKSYKDNTIINKEINGTTNMYYQVDNYYYIKNENNEFGLIENNIIYDLINSKYIELPDVLKLIDKANLDHVVDSSNNDKESVYNLLVRDIVISNKSDDIVTIKVVEGDSKLSINIDYTNLMKVLDNSIEKCEISYVYTNIDKVEEFKIME